MMKSFRRNNNNGITLIALVITIIVLLILAAVSIATLTGENGILTRANDAKTKTEQAKEDELRRLTALEATTNLENKEYIDNNEDKAIIPAGFAVSQVEGENIIDDGLVIIDKNGNEFVWIPVASEDKYIRNITFFNEDVSKETYTDMGYLPEKIQPDIPETITDEKEIGLLNEKEEKQVILKSGGFYVSRFEAGKEGESSLVSKKYATIWSEISQEDCKKVAKTFINNEYVKSALCSGIQWDVMMEFVNGKEDGSNGGNKIFDVTKYKASRHTGMPEKSGKNEIDKVCNIYDLEGNYREYVAEKSSFNLAFPIVHRGGIYDSNVTTPASGRNSYNGEAFTNVSFRFVLYIV